jgi:predicted transcriptional regulator
MGRRPRFKQVEVAKYLGISDSAVSKVFLAVSGKSGDS